MTTALWVALGGAAGSLARYGLATAINIRGHPWGTVVVNVVGSFVLGMLIGTWGFKAQESHRIGIAVGALGGFTTFSTFALDTLFLWENGQPGLAIANVMVSIVAGIAAAVVGLAVGRSLA